MTLSSTRTASSAVERIVISFRKRRFFNLVIALFIVSGTTSIAQQGITVKPDKVIPPSPDAAALGKYGSIPVGLHTGIPNINIPIYTIRAGMLEVPISLSYHASGNKVSEFASWVGLGWSLNAGGSVMRSVVGRSDENGFFETTVKTASQITMNDYEYLIPFLDGEGDYESDYYFYNFNGRSGKFIYKQNSPSTPFLIPKEPIHISWEGIWFRIVDEQGVTYIFGHPETTETHGPSPQQYASAYYLTQIISPDGKDHIVFSYFYDTTIPELTTSYTTTIGQSCPGVGPATNGYENHHYITTSRTIHPIRLAEITFTNGKIKFVPDATRSDLPGSRLDQIQIFGRNPDGSWEASPRKTFVLGEGYFGSGVSSRLKLTHLEERNRVGTTVAKHSFYYNESTSLPARTSNAQDWWGFYNGKDGNTSLIASQVITFSGATYMIGAADREPNSAAMQAGILKKIVYPTAGYTEFDYEPHYYVGTSDELEDEHVITPISTSQDWRTNAIVFTLPVGGTMKLRTRCSDVKYVGDPPTYSRIKLRDVSQTAPILQYAYDPIDPYGNPMNPWPSEDEQEFTVNLVQGKTYELTVEAKGESNSSRFGGIAFAEAALFYQKQVSNVTLMAGGLRIKEIRDYESPTSVPLTRTFKYGANESGTGTLLVPQYGISNSKQEIEVHWFASSCGTEQSSCCATPGCFANRLVVTGSPGLDLTSLNGAPVVYEEVTVYETSPNGQNGKSIHVFDVQEDEFTGVHKAYNNGRWQMNTGWKGGDQIWSASYVGSTSNKVNENSTAYQIYIPETTYGTKVGWKVQTDGCYPANQTSSHWVQRMYYFDVPFHTGAKKISLTNERTYSSTQPSKYVEKQTIYEYDNLNANHQQVSRTITTDSEGLTQETHYWYPADYATSVSTTQDLLAAHIIAAPIKVEMHKGDKLIGGKVTKFNAHGKPIEVYQYETSTPQTAPAHDNATLVPPGYTKKMDITYHPTTKVINTVQLSNDVKISYLWGYNDRYPIAEITNADPAQVSYTSFEMNGVLDANAKTGSRVWSGVYSLSLPQQVGAYQLSYWKRTGSGPWEKVTSSVNVTSSGQSVNIGVAGSVIDEVRVLPAGARMKTYTYDFITGITSATDENQVTTYYTYDTSERLRSVRDNNKNVLKTFDYNYVHR